MGQQVEKHCSLRFQEPPPCLAVPSCLPLACGRRTMDQSEQEKSGRGPRLCAALRGRGVQGARWCVLGHCKGIRWKRAVLCLLQPAWQRQRGSACSSPAARLPFRPALPAVPQTPRPRLGAAGAGGGRVGARWRPCPQGCVERRGTERAVRCGTGSGIRGNGGQRGCATVVPAVLCDFRAQKPAYGFVDGSAIPTRHRSHLPTYYSSFPSAVWLPSL